MDPASLLASPILQYGAFAIILAVLIGVYALQKNRDKEQSTRQDRSDSFLHRLVDKNLESRDAEIEAYKDLSAELIRSNAAMAVEFRAVTEALKAHDEKTTAAYGETVKRIAEIWTASQKEG